MSQLAQKTNLLVQAVVAQSGGNATRLCHSNLEYPDVDVFFASRKHSVPALSGSYNNRWQPGPSSSSCTTNKIRIWDRSRLEAILEVQL